MTDLLVKSKVFTAIAHRNTPTMYIRLNFGVTMLKAFIGKQIEKNLSMVRPNRLDFEKSDDIYFTPVMILQSQSLMVRKSVPETSFSQWIRNCVENMNIKSDKVMNIRKMFPGKALSLGLSKIPQAKRFPGIPKIKVITPPYICSHLEARSAHLKGVSGDVDIVVRADDVLSTDEVVAFLVGVKALLFVVSSVDSAAMVSDVVSLLCSLLIGPAVKCFSVTMSPPCSAHCTSLFKLKIKTNYLCMFFYFIC